MAHKWLINRHAYRDLWQNFEHTQMNQFENVKNLENEALFPNENHKKLPAKKLGYSSFESRQKNEKLKFDQSGGFYIF